MSLIRVRRDRKRDWIDQKRGIGPMKLAGLLLFVILVIWYVGFRF